MKSSKKIGELGQTYGDEYLNWKTWEDSQFGKLKKTKSAYFSAEIKRANKVFSKKSTVLEIGFGNGEFLNYARENDWDICGTEANKALVEIANKYGFNAKHSEDLSLFEDSTYDLIVAFDVLEHIPQERLPNFILDISRVLKNDGVFLARFPNGDSPFGLINQNGDATHLTTLGSNKIKYFAAKANMQVIFVGGEVQPIIGTSPKTFIHRAITLPIQMLLNLFVNLIFFPHGYVEFCSSNLTIILKRKN
jgi:2-polyprenyl-3-methyl-5-hydroxy-6-metoxy-1,4-benzoquinol methylase